MGNFAQGMVVSVPLHYSWLTVDGQKRGGEALHEALIKHYAATAEGAQFVTVAPLGEVRETFTATIIEPNQTKPPIEQSFTHHPTIP